jgi:Plasmid recombination enzyme
VDEGPVAMKTLFFFAAKTIGLSKRAGRKPCSLLSAARHNLREIQAELGADGRMDAKRSQFNEIIFGESKAADVNAFAQKTLFAWRIQQRRKDYVQAIEMVFSLPANSSLDQLAYFQTCLDWVFHQMGRENVLSAVVHRDEAAPHCHVLILPCKEKRYLGGQLIKRGPLMSLRKSFEQDVAHKHGLRAGSKKNMSALERNEQSQMVLDYLQRSHDPVVKSHIWAFVRQEIQLNPEGYLDSLGLSYEPTKVTKKIRTSTQIMTSVGRKTSQDRKALQGINAFVSYKRDFDQYPSCVGITQKSTGIDPANPSTALLKNEVENKK